MRSTLRGAAYALVAVVGAVALAGCDDCTEFVATRPAQLLTSGQYTLTPRQLATSSLPAVNARGTVAVTIDRAASTLRMRWTHTEGTAYDETWRIRP